MNKKVYAEVMDRSEGLCENCGSNGGGWLECHHIIYGISKRKRHEREESCVMLCKSCHDKAHNTKLGLDLKLKLQETYFNLYIDESKVMEMMGDRIYIENDYERYKRGE